MMAFSVTVNAKVKKLLVTTTNFGQVTLIIFQTLDKLKMSATVTLLTLDKPL